MVGVRQLLLPQLMLLSTGRLQKLLSPLHNQDSYDVAAASTKHCPTQVKTLLEAAASLDAVTRRPGRPGCLQEDGCFNGGGEEGRRRE